MSKKEKGPKPYGYFGQKGTPSLKLYPFSCIAEENSPTLTHFSIGGSLIVIQKLLVKKNEFEKNFSDVKQDPISYAQIADNPVLVAKNRTIIAGPRLHQYLGTDQFRHTTVPILERLGLKATGHQIDGLTLSIAGDEATLALNHESYYLAGTPNVEEGIGEYRFFNADSEQKRRLFVGLGFIASQILSTN